MTHSLAKEFTRISTPAEANASKYRAHYKRGTTQNDLSRVRMASVFIWALSLLRTTLDGYNGRESATTNAEIRKIIGDLPITSARSYPTLSDCMNQTVNRLYRESGRPVVPRALMRA
jgi:hypothetical protein